MSNSKLDDVFGVLYDELVERKKNGELAKVNTVALIVQVREILKLKEVTRQATGKGEKKKKKMTDGVGVFKSFRGQK